MHLMCVGSLGGQRVWDPLEWSYWQLWVLGREPWSAVRAVRTPHCRVISPAI